MGESKNMNAIIFTNIGNRDIGNKGTPIYNTGGDVYEESKRLFESKRFTDMEAILLEPVINYIKNKNHIERIYLFGTEQIKIHPQDTYYIAFIIKEILKKRFELIDEKIRVIQVACDPSDRDEMYDFYEKFFGSLTEGGLVFISLAGGTPAQNEALLFNSVAKFKSDVQGLYLPKGSTKVKALDVSGRIYKKGLKDQVEVLKEKYLYDGAIDLVDRYGLDEDLDLLKAKNYEALFDFENSLKYYEKAVHRYSGEKRAEIHEKIERISRLKTGLRDDKELSEDHFLTYISLLEELYINMKIKWVQGAYIDFIGRLFRFEEAVLRFVFEKETKISTEKKRGEYSDFCNFVKSDEEICKFLEECSIKLDRLEPNRKVLGKILEFWIRKKNKGEKLGQIFGFLKKTNTPEGKSLADMRNKSILAHGFKGISKEEFEKMYNGDILKDMGGVLNLLKDYEKCM